MAQTMEFEDEFELEDEWEDEWEDEDFSFGGLVNGLSGLLGEGEDEDEGEGEDFSFGGLVNGVSGLLGEGEDEDEDEAEEFFKGIGRFLKKAAPILKVIAKTAGPLVATAVGGPAAGALAGKLTSMLEGEDEQEWESEFEALVTAPLTSGQAEAEAFAAQAAGAASEGEAEALVGAATLAALSPEQRRALRRLLPHLLKGASLVSGLLYGTPSARDGLRLMPTIADQTAGSITRAIEAGQQVGPADAGRIMGQQVTRVLGDPRHAAMALRRHHRGVHGHHHPRRGHVSYGHRGSAVAPARVVHGSVGRPRAGTVRVVTPVRVPGRAGHPTRHANVVTDVRLPRGAVPAARAAVVRPPTRAR